MTTLSEQLIWFAASLVYLVFAISVGIREIVRKVRHRRALKRLNSTMKGADDIMEVFAQRFIERNMRTTRYGDRRFRDGIVTSELPPREVESF